MPTFHDTAKHWSGSIDIRLTDPKLCEALRKHCADNRNTHTGIAPTYSEEIEAILYYFLITLKGSSK